MMFVAVGCENGQEKQESEVSNCWSWVRNATPCATWSPRDCQPAAWKCACLFFFACTLQHHSAPVAWIGISHFPIMHCKHCHSVSCKMQYMFLNIVTLNVHIFC